LLLPAPAPTLPGQSTAVTMIADTTRRTGGQAVPDMVQPAQPKMNTMRIATPLGYSSRPPRKVWPIVLVAGLLLGLGGGVVAVALVGRNSSKAAADTGSAAAANGAGSAPGSAIAVTPARPDAASAVTPGAGSAIAVTPARPDAAIAVTPIVDAAPAMASVVIDSTPQGAEVVGPDKKPLGKTPVKLSLPISDMPLEYELSLAGYRKKTHPVVVSGNTVINVPLEKAAVVRPPGGGGHTHKGSSHGDDNGLERPE